jgi:hypothetical protein
VNPAELSSFLNRLVASNIKLSTMIWGPPGIGKSSIVAQTASAHKIGFIDLRLSQLAPTDLRGLPVADAKRKSSTWYAPEFLPKRGHGVLFLDEINLAPPTMQGMAQQLILDRRVGNYVVPQGWFIWAAGNRKEDRATVFDMPAPLGNRFIHLEVSPDLDSFKTYALLNRVDPRIISFVSFRPELLHRLDAQQPAWPSPRSWVMASALLDVGLDVAPAIGAACATEFKAFLDLYSQIPNLRDILEGKANKHEFPSEPSVRYATVIGLMAAAQTGNEGYNAIRWLTSHASAEWVQLCAIDLNRVMRARKQHRAYQTLVNGDSELRDQLKEWLGDKPTQ